jgi:serine/threonine protein kinase
MTSWKAIAKAKANTRPIVKTPTVSKEQFHAITSGEYIPISMAGQGKDGEVWYAIPASSDVSIDLSPPKHGIGNSQYDSGLYTDVTHFDSTVKHFLREKLCAVKIPAQSRYRECVHEIAVLNSLQEAPENIRSNFPQILNAKTLEQLPYITSIPGDVPSPKPLYFVMSAVHPGITLLGLSKSTLLLEVPVPDSLIAHITLQLSDTISWMHEDLVPPLAHLDLQSSNVMLDMAHLEENGLPHVVLIDFATAMQSNENCFNFDRTCLYSMIYNLAILNQPYSSPNRSENVIGNYTHRKDWKRFIGTLACPESSSNPGHMISNDEFSGKFRDMLIMKRTNICEEDMQTIEMLLQKGVEMASGLGKEEIRAVISELVSRLRAVKPTVPKTIITSTAKLV